MTDTKNDAYEIDQCYILRGEDTVTIVYKQPCTHMKMNKQQLDNLIKILIKHKEAFVHKDRRGNL
jgi:hypothetical protein